MAQIDPRKRRRTYRIAFSAMIGLAMLFVCATPSPLIGEEYQMEAAKRHRFTKLHSWLGAQEGASGAVEALAHSILRESEKHSVNPGLVLAVIKVESRFDQKAVSPRGAQGLMQVKQVVVDELVDQGKLPARRHNLKDPQVNVEIGVSYLAHLIDMFGDVNTALAAYNAGPTRIRDKLAANETIPSFYVSKVLSAQRSLENELARLELENIEAAG